jgi:RND family efflux transporter MFP subunit
MTNENKPNTQESPQAGRGAAQSGGHDHEAAPEQKPISGGKALAGVVILLLVAALLAGWGLISRRSTNTVLAKRTDELAAPSVLTAVPKRGAPVNSFVLPGNVTAYTDSPIYARTSGYLTKWYYDIGARVKKDALLAEIATPELDQQVSQAESQLVTAQATANLAHIQADRYNGLVKSNAVSHQDTDTFVNQAAATAAAVKTAQANVQQLRALQSFEKIYAPFDGVVTARNIDTGQLINQGAGTELFHLQAIQTLRVYANVPQIYSANLKRGQKIDVTFAEHAGKTFQGTLVRTANAIDPASRTLLVEIDLVNRAGELLPGSLAQVHFDTPVTTQTFIVPAAALLFRREGLRLGTVVNGNTARLVPVVIGEDDGANVQIVGGLNDGDEVIQDPPDALIDGEKVQLENPGHKADAGGK